MVKCVFCGREEVPYKGVNVILNDGSTNFFCGSKCRKNSLKLKRDKRKLKWTASFSEERVKIADRATHTANADKVDKAEQAKSDEKAHQKKSKKK